MNFDDMKSAWKSDLGQQVLLPDTIDKIKSAGMPVDKLRKLMLKEFFTQVAVTILFFYAPSFLPIAPAHLMPFYFLYIVFLMICIYYFLKFYLFYKRLNQPALNSKDNLYTLYYDILLNVEMYKSFSYSISPFVLAYSYMYLSNRLNADIDMIFKTDGSNLLFIGLGVIVGMVFIVLTFILTEYYVKISYGKYAAQVKQLLDELVSD
jgi:hypothetical protein